MLISDLLEYSSIGRSNNDYQPIDLRSLIANVVSGLDIEKEAEIQLPEDYPPMNGYIVQIDQLFSNLLSNAIKYKRNDVGLEIAISWVDNPNDWQFCIEDNGIGIDDKYRHKIFELFHRLHTQEEYAGTGVGLSIVKKVVEEHGGKVWVKSIPEKGSTFYFTISKNIKKEII